ncbi:MAG TPA: hypothetical protein PKN80_08845, partial [bacterium]|nr:hypothetical protein [bacterium]HNS49443.1 hypothetical protein [bacterium]
MKKRVRPGQKTVLLSAAAVALLLAWTAAAAGQGRTETAYRRFIEVENFRIEGKGHQVRAHENSSGGATMDSVFPDTGRLEAGGRLLFTLETPRPAGRYLVWLNTLPLAGSRTAAGPIRIEAGLGRTAGMIEIRRNARYNWGYAFIEARESFQEISLKVRSLEDRLWLDCLYLSNQPADLKANGRDGRPEINLKAIRVAAAGRSGSAAGEKTANRLANGGFEAGLGSYYWSTLYQQSYALKPEFWDRQEAYEGSASLRLTLFPEVGRRLGDDPGLPTAFRLMHRSLELEPDRAYCFRAMVKADTPLLVRFSASPAQPPETGRIRPAGQAILQADGQWRPLEAELKTLGAGQDYLLRLEAEATGPARLWLDALTLTDTRLEAFRPA